MTPLACTSARRSFLLPLVQVGNVYIKFRDEEAAAKALQVRPVKPSLFHSIACGRHCDIARNMRAFSTQALQGRYYDGRPIIAEFSPVS